MARSFDSWCLAWWGLLVVCCTALNKIVPTPFSFIAESSVPLCLCEVHLFSLLGKTVTETRWHGVLIRGGFQNPRCLCDIVFFSLHKKMSQAIMSSATDRGYLLAGIRDWAVGTSTGGGISDESQLDLRSPHSETLRLNLN